MMNKDLTKKRVLSIDVGIATTGWAVIDKINGKLELLAYGVIITKPKASVPSRLKIIYDELLLLIDDYKPTDFAAESLFYFKNQKTIINVSQARGVIILAAETKFLELNEYTPLQVKTALTGYGRADKKQIQKMVQLYFKLKEIPKPDDAADAIALGICHFNFKK